VGKPGRDSEGVGDRVETQRMARDAIPRAGELHLQRYIDPSCSEKARLGGRQVQASGLFRRLQVPGRGRTSVLRLVLEDVPPGTQAAEIFERLEAAGEVAPVQRGWRPVGQPCLPPRWSGGEQARHPEPAAGAVGPAQAGGRAPGRLPPGLCRRAARGERTGVADGAVRGPGGEQ
jgi:hypothetical protein